jgi:hypothetical protein
MESAMATGIRSLYSVSTPRLKRKRIGTTMTERVLQQIPIPEDERQEIKSYASTRGMKIYNMTDEVLEWYFRRLSEDKLPILASPKVPEGNKYWSIWILSEHMAHIEDIAEQERCSGNRVIYSAFKNWLQEKGA